MMSDKQQFFNISSSILAFGVSFSISFILTPYLIFHIGKEAYSFFPMSNNMVNYVLIATLALNSMVARYISISFNKGDVHLAKSYYSTSFYSNLIVVVVIFFPVITFSLNINSFINVPEKLLFDIRWLFTLIFFSLLVDLLSVTFGSSTFVVNRMDLKSLTEIFKSIIRILSFYLLFVTFEPNIIFVGVVALLVSVLNFFIQYSLSRKLIPKFNIALSLFDFRLLMKLLKSGGWNVVNALGVSLLLGMALIMTNKFVGVSEAGDLSLAMMLPAFITTIISMISSTLVPKMTQIYALEGKESFKQEVIFSQSILSQLTTTPILVVIVVSDFFYKLWLPTEYSKVLTNLSCLLLFPLIIHSNVWCFFNSNAIVNKIKTLSIILLVFGFLNIVSCMVVMIFYSSSIYVIPAISIVVNILYYSVIVPVLTSKNTGLSLRNIYSILIRSILFSSVFIIVFNHFVSLVIVSDWFELFFISFFIGCAGYLFHWLLLFKLNFLTSFFKRTT